jgi:hypothetical protein
VKPLRALQPLRTAVDVDADGLPVQVGGRSVVTVREEWRVEEGWWDTPVRRRYFELALEDGHLLVVFEDRLQPGTWWRQRA